MKKAKARQKTAKRKATGRSNEKVSLQPAIVTPGEVFLGEHLLLRRQCAIKLIRPEQAGDPTNLLRFEREVQAFGDRSFQ